MPYVLRRLFATLLVYSCPNNPKELWLKFEYAMSEDIIRSNTLTSRQVRMQVLEQINGFLQSMGKDINAFDLVPRDLVFANLENQTREIRAERTIVITQEDLHAILMLNDK
ncbi:hypothetical protein ACH5RR_006330 [Cinchona calisaya]|uniref:Uncharacterized protein n=1 Tax=Cinchona calisaya TaxID=153742 RepID=A0ABD3ANQ9_9GENT